MLARSTLTTPLRRAGPPIALKGALTPSRRASRCLSSAAPASSSSSTTQQEQQASSSSSHTDYQQAHHSSSSSSSQHPDASTLILLDTLSHIPQYGFTKQAYLHPSPSAPLNPEEISKRSRILIALFPGPDMSFDAKLYSAFNKVADLSAIHSLSMEEVVEALRSGNDPSSAGPGKPVNMQHLSEPEETLALQKVYTLIEQRLALSWTVKPHLMHGLTALSTASPTTSALHSILPHQTVLPNLPNPGPLLDLSNSFINEALGNPEAQRRTGWIDPDGPEWYTVRSRLTLAYVAATLHAAAPSIQSFEDTQRLFRGIVRGRENGLLASVQTLAGSGKEWVRWGGRGWLGVLRSLGL